MKKTKIVTSNRQCHNNSHASNMNSLFLATVCITCSLGFGIVEAQSTPPGHDPVSLHKKTKFRDPLQVKKIILECDTDKSGELSTEEFAKCVRPTISD